jgi:glucose/arabinose dehydrogenase
MKNRNTIIVVILVLLATTGVVGYKNFSGVGPAVLPPAGNIASDITQHNALPPGENDTKFPLKLPDGFKIEVFADKLPDARVIVDAGNGTYLVSQPSEGKISEVNVAVDGSVSVGTLLKGLKNPHGLAVDQNGRSNLYYAEENGLSRLPLFTEASPVRLADLPAGGEHTTRSLGFGPDGKLYVAIGSTCNVCRETDPERAAIYTWDEKGGLQPFAKGLRNTVFFTWDSSGNMLGNDMGRDFLGDDLPPDELNILQAGKNYGWPICYGKDVHDTDFDKNVYIRDPCADSIAPAFEYPAHSAPLGLAFAPSSWPTPYGGRMIVAFHGSWNRSVPTGYKLVALTKNHKGGFDGMQDFITGWLQNGQALGRPVDVLTVGDAMFVTDDKAGLVYKITYASK